MACLRVSELKGRNICESKCYQSACKASAFEGLEHLRIGVLANWNVMKMLAQQAFMRLHSQSVCESEHLWNRNAVKTIVWWNVCEIG